MQAHPIPQNVVSFEDRIFGPLTAKQFTIIAAGFSISFVMYMSPLPGSIKIPAVVLLVLISLAAGLVKINEMTLDTWLITFFGAIYSPTQFVWEKEIGASFLNVQINKRDKNVAPLPAQTQKIKQELYPTLFTEAESDETEQKFLASLDFNVPFTPSISPERKKKGKDDANLPEIAPQFAPLEEELKISIKRLEHTEIPTPKISLPPKEISHFKASPQKIPQPEVLPTRRQIIVEPEKGVQKQLASELNFNTDKPVISYNISGQIPKFMESLSATKVNRALKKEDIEKSDALSIKGEKVFTISEKLRRKLESNDLQIKRLEVLKIENKPDPPTPHISVEKLKETISSEKINSKIEKPKESPLLEKQKTQKELTPPTPLKPVLEKTPLPPLSIKPTPLPPSTSSKPVYKPLVTPPKTPTPPIKPNISQFIPNKNSQNRDFNPPQIPNIIAGIVRNIDQTVLANAIVLIKDSEKSPVRALKTNSLGQFAIITPLPNGKYYIEFEKEGCQFNPISLELKGETLSLLNIVAIQNK